MKQDFLAKEWIVFLKLLWGQAALILLSCFFLCIPQSPRAWFVSSATRSFWEGKALVCLKSWLAWHLRVVSTRTSTCIHRQWYPFLKEYVLCWCVHDRGYTGRWECTRWCMCGGQGATFRSPFSHHEVAVSNFSLLNHLTSPNVQFGFVFAWERAGHLSLRALVWQWQPFIALRLETLK